MGSSGRLVLDQLVVSQPGTVKLKLFSSTLTTADIHINNNKGKKKNKKSGDPWSNLSMQDSERIHLASLLVLVRRDPDAPDPTPCLFIFKDAMCANTVHGDDDWHNLHPVIRGKLPSTSLHWGLSMACSDIWNEWFIQVHQIPNSVTSSITGRGWAGGVWFEYRAGIDSIWTGHAFPTHDMTAIERLGLMREWGSKQDIRDGIRQEQKQHEAQGSSSTSTVNLENLSEKTTNKTSGGFTSMNDQQQPHQQQRNATSSGRRSGNSGNKVTRKSSGSRAASRRRNQIAKELRRAYYKQSLLWHPDRWASMPLYTTAVSGAFHLITDAYTQLNNYLNEAVEEVEAEGIQTSSSSSSSSSARSRNGEVPTQDEVVYA